MKYITYISIFIILLCIEIRVYCKYIVQNYWTILITLWKKYINLDTIGLWDHKHATIKKANKNLYAFMYSKANIHNTDTVLHLGKKKKKEKAKKKWDKIIAIEKDWTNLHHLLNDNGTLVCSNIVFKDNTPSSLYLDTICDFLCIPKISYSEWKSCLENNYTLELHDITENSINPYYTYLFHSFVTKKHLPQWVADILIYYFKDIPCHYIVAICKLK